MSENPNAAVQDRETWITLVTRDWTCRYWGDPEETIDWKEFQIGTEQDEPEETDEIPDPPAEACREPVGADCDAKADLANDCKASPKEPSPSVSGKGASKLHPPLAVRMADVAPEPVEWLWEPYIPKGKLTSIEGDPGVGKSWLTMALAAQISRGEKLPGVKQTAEPASVLLLTAEDGAADTIRPRLDAAGADVDRVHAITAPLSFDKAGAATLKREIEAVRPALVIIDPIVAYLPERTDINSASAVRPVLARLAKVAEETGVAIAFVRHLAKGTRDKAIYRGLGSIDFTAACRSVLMVGFDPNDASKRVVAHAKSNLAAPGPSLAYTLKGGRFAWAGRSPLSAEDLGPPPDADQRRAREEARDFLVQTLADGPKPQLEVQAEAAKIHISIASLRRAKGDLGVKAKKTPDHWEWSLPPRPLGGDTEGQDAQAPGVDYLEHLEQSLE
jgi:hypothetical protein